MDPPLSVARTPRLESVTEQKNNAEVTPARAADEEIQVYLANPAVSIGSSIDTEHAKY